MTAVKVVDASALAAVLFAEPEAEAVAIALEGARLIAPALIHFEIANVCLTKIRRQRNDRDALCSALGLLDAFNLQIVPIDHAATVDLAQTTGLTTYDASYLWLALTMDAELVTLDRKLAKAKAARIESD